MSDVAERVKAARERDEARAEQDETESPDFQAPEIREGEPEPPTEPEPAPEPEPEPETPAGQLTAERAADLEKATTAYFKRVEKIFGAADVPPACPACEGLGFDLTGGAGQPEYAEHDHYIACSDCRGLGHVKTGSLVPGHDLHDCPKCLGRGYLEKVQPIAAVPSEPEAYGTPAWMGTVAPAPGQ